MNIVVLIKYEYDSLQIHGEDKLGIFKRNIDAIAKWGREGLEKGETRERISGSYAAGM